LENEMSMGNTMTATDLHRVLHNAVLFTAPNKVNIPMISAVRLEFSGDQVLSVATDRFVLGVSHADYTGEEFDVLIGRDDADRIAKLAKTKPTTRNYGEPPRSVAIEHDGNTITFTFTTGEALTINTLDCQFPKFRQLLPSETDEPASPAYTAVDPARLAQFTKVVPHSDDEHGMSVTLTKPERPVMVQVGDHFVGALMPVKGYQAWNRPAWL
jgi:DNA polymerase III sliding clamp (beta) subunit (PCNA family)